MNLSAAQLRDLLALGIEGERLAAVVAVLETSRDASRDSHADKLERDRTRQQKRRDKIKEMKAATEANDAVASIISSADASRDDADERCCLPSLSIKEGASEEVKEEEKKGLPAVVVDRGRRATRLLRDAELPEADREFARSHSLDPDRTWAEFIDYWIAIPGQRGTKLDWSATFRNRVRQIATRQEGRNGQQKDRSVLAAFDRLKQQLTGGDDNRQSQADLLRLSSR